MGDLKGAVIGCSGCQAIIIVLTGLIGIIIHFTTLKGAEKVYNARYECGNVVGYEDYKCVKIDPKVKYYDYGRQGKAIPQEDIFRWGSSQGKICQKQGADDAWVTLKQTCDKALTMCQIWLSDATVGISASVGSADPQVKAGVTVVDECAAGNCKTPEQKHLDDRCGLTDEGLIRTDLVYEFNNWIEDDMMVPPFPRPAVWMIYKLVQVVRNLAKPMGWSEDGIGRNVELLLDSFPLMHIMLGENLCIVAFVSAVGDFCKFTIAPTLMLGFLTSMVAPPCEGNAACESNTENMNLSFNADFGMTTYLYMATIIHLFLIFCGSCGLPCCIGSEPIEPGCNFKTNRCIKIGAAIMTLLDLGIVIGGLWAFFMQLTRAKIGFAMIFEMAFAFNAGFGVDLFQLFAAFAFFYDIGATILHKMLKVLGLSEKAGN